MNEYDEVFMGGIFDRAEKYYIQSLYSRAYFNIL